MLAIYIISFFISTACRAKFFNKFGLIASVWCAGVVKGLEIGEVE